LRGRSAAEEAFVNSKSDVVDRFLAALLIVGGLFGAAIFLYPIGRILYDANRGVQPIQWVSLLPLVVLLALFAWSAIVGVRLWRRESRGWRWAAILFAMQVPILTVPELRYEYYTGIAIEFMGGHAANRLSLELGSAASVLLGGRISDPIYGINLFALVAVIYLLTQKMRYGKPQTM
jgi:hypothetical protein